MSIIILILILIIFGAALNIANRMTFIRGKKVYWIFSSYVIVLIASSLFYFTVLKADHQNTEQLSTKHLPNLEEIAYNDESLEPLNLYLVKKEQITYSNDELTMQMNDPNYTYIPVLVERKKENDNLIDVSFYQIPTIIEGVDVTDEFKQLELSLTNHVLTFTMDDVYIDLNISKQEFPFRQFTGEKIFYNEKPPLNKPNQLVHLKIPRNIKLHAEDNMSIHYRD